MLNNDLGLFLSKLYLFLYSVITALLCNIRQDETSWNVLSTVSNGLDILFRFFGIRDRHFKHFLLRAPKYLASCIVVITLDFC